LAVNSHRVWPGAIREITIMFLARSGDAISPKCGAPMIDSFRGIGPHGKEVADTVQWLAGDRRSGGGSMVRFKSFMLGCSILAALSEASADDLRLAGKFAFQTDVNLDNASCTLLTQATASRLASPPYRCESTPLSSGKTALLCSRSPGGRGGYMVFNTKAACESERKDQAAAE
jgi:hypothetical protein